MQNEDFLAFVGPPALAIERTRGYPAEALMTQVHLETAGLIDYPKGSNNVLGIKFNGEGEYVEAWTTEYIDGKPQRVLAKFQVYPSVVDCLQAWADLMDKPWYAQAKPYRHDWAAFLALIWHNGEHTVYATDVLYLWKAVKRAVEVGIPAWCAANRHPAVTLDRRGERTPGYRLVKGNIEGPVRPFLNELAKREVGWVYDPTTYTLRLILPPAPGEHIPI